MGTDATIDRVKKELLLAFDNTRAELDRIEIWPRALPRSMRPFRATNRRSGISPRVNLGSHELAADEPRT